MEGKKNEAKFIFTPKKLIRIQTKLQLAREFEFFLFVKFWKVRFLDWRKMESNKNDAKCCFSRIKDWFALRLNYDFHTDLNSPCSWNYPKGTVPYWKTTNHGFTLEKSIQTKLKGSSNILMLLYSNNQFKRN